ncbi:hypothetical protein [Nocardioides nematodiphilus]|uniref:hypothetical protein n=1 Tax=Nocardioides nematodiphilus TaxID=2849669 RepID=UPI001CDA15DD|nr:hypothetical protein [Nocardioides nematodiphilus]MCA1984733.1 hypothetical protein [Nocardioides nematodiphilus]
MKLYADSPARRGVQAAGDLAAVLYVVLCIAVAAKVHDAALRLATPGREIDSSATHLASRLHDAGQSLAGVPLVGDSVSSPFDGASGAASALATAGQRQEHAATALANWLGVMVVLLPVVLLLVFYLPPRIRFVRRATAGQRLLDAGAGPDLFALRALTNQPLHVLARIDEDPVAGWRRHDPAVIERLARLELSAAGLHPPGRR